MSLLNAGEKFFEDGYGVRYFFTNCHDWNVAPTRAGFTSANPESGVSKGQYQAFFWPCRGAQSRGKEEGLSAEGK
jgi:hypothetical protein